MRMWEIRENTERYGRRGYKSEKSAEEAYECGYEDGYKAAIEEIEEDMRKRYK